MKKKPLFWHKLYSGGIKSYDKAFSFEIQEHDGKHWLFSYIQEDDSKAGNRRLFARPFECISEDSARRLAESYNEHN